MNKPFVLIIEDDRDIAALFRHVVDMVGYRTAIALNGKDAIDRLSTSKPDIVILDPNLSGVSGEEILKKWTIPTASVVHRAEGEHKDKLNNV